jgi:hypothetical protein
LCNTCETLNDLYTIFGILCNNRGIAEVEEGEIESTGRTGAKIGPGTTVDITVVVVQPDNRLIHSAEEQIAIHKRIFRNNILGIDESYYETYNY